MPINDFVPVATGGGANVLSQASYLASPLLGPGNQTGIASSAFNNKALRQASFMASCLAQLLVNSTDEDVLDNGVQADVLATMALMWPSTTPTTTLLTSTGAAAGYLFTVSGANATVGATYTNNGNTYTVLSTIAGADLLFCSGASAPTSSGTLTKATGTGDSSITFSANQPLAQYSAPANVKYLKIKMVGGGGGAASSGTTGYTGGEDGTLSTFGSSLFVCGGGLGAQGPAAQPASGGSASITGITGLAVFGSYGGPGCVSNGIATTGYGGGSGGTSPFGGSGGGGLYDGSSASGKNASANSGSGGGGGGAFSASVGNYSGGGGGSGGYIEAVISSPVSTYYYSVGTGGVGASAGSNGFAGGNGANGCILIEEHYGI